MDLAMRIALKEWAVVIAAIARGRQVFLLRKGGIAEGREGFELRHAHFVFYPTWEHQHAELVRPEFHGVFDCVRPPSRDGVPIEFAGKVDAIRAAPDSAEALAAMTDAHIWNEKLIRMRYEYRPDLPLYMVLVRAYRLAQPVQILYDHRYAGCRSWVELNSDVDINGAEPVLTDDEFARAAAAVRGGASVAAR